MKTERKILVAFILNLLFSVFEIIGGVFTGSVAIISDAVHDIGDAASIGISYVLEKKSRKQPDNKYTYGYLRFSVLGGFITTFILLAGSLIVIYNSVLKFFKPTDINSNGMIFFAIIGVGVNFFAAFFTREGNSLNLKAVNLHMLEDVLGWVVVLVGGVLIKFTGIAIIDPLMSICVSLYILYNALKNLKEVAYLFLEKTPVNIDITEIKQELENIDGVKEAHHIHIWSMDTDFNYATMHIVTNSQPQKIKKEIRTILNEHNINHITIEIEKEDEFCCDKECRLNFNSHAHSHSSHCHHHH